MSVIGKLRWGYVFLYENVEERLTKGCMAETYEVTKTGKVFRIEKNTNKKLLRYYPADELCLYIKWNDGKAEWHPADAYMRMEDGKVARET